MLPTTISAGGYPESLVQFKLLCKIFPCLLQIFCARFCQYMIFISQVDTDMMEIPSTMVLLLRHPHLSRFPQEDPAAIAIILDLVQVHQELMENHLNLRKD